ncbi:glycosyltransferase [Amantichitinum ursilacus]|uniref:Putative glycosyltransferase EpsE n=1 Tax=Amantichitinum ursilacus TaxID=857265 RepID=A0A0N0XMP9_9NEIS|nr:glycosyltransferase [Amantichitinum ursilacus]KPC54416.1 putative glycosyltransferase EpsE [Amantichitinum ursilacus]
MTRISVVMATYQGTAFLPQQLVSLAQQTRLPDELIIADDASSDGSLDIAKSVALPFTVHYFRQAQRVGYAHNFAAAAGQARGDLILFCDQDDVWLPHKIAQIEAQAATSSAQVFTHDLSWFSAERPAAIPSYFAYLNQLGLDRAVCLKGCALAVRAEFIAQHGWPDPAAQMPHDFWFAFLGTALQQRAFIDPPLLRHRMHGGNASAWLPQWADLQFLRPEQLAHTSAVAQLIDLCIKPRTVRWIAPLLETLGRIDTPAAHAAIALLQSQRARLGDPPP